MISMTKFVSAGGIKTVLDHAAEVKVLDVTITPSTADNLDVDIRFRFQNAETAPFFADLLGDDRADNSSESPAPRMPVSMLSDEATPRNCEVDSNGQHSNDLVTPMSESNTDEWLSSRGSGKERLVIEAQNEAIFMPDSMWIKRTKPLSSILKEREPEKATSCAIITSSREDVHDVEQTDKKSKDKDKTGEGTAKRAANSAENGHPLVEDEVLPNGFDFLRASSLKAAVKAIRCSFSRDEKSDEPCEDINATDSSVHSARAKKTTSRTKAQSEDEIQPNHVPPNVVPVSAINPDLPASRKDAQRNERARDRSATRGNLLRKTSNLARNLFRKLGTGDASEDPSRMGKRRPLFRKRRAGANEEDNFEPNVGQFKNIKRPRLIFGRRYKE